MAIVHCTSKDLRIMDKYVSLGKKLTYMLNLCSKDLSVFSVQFLISVLVSNCAILRKSYPFKERVNDWKLPSY